MKRSLSWLALAVVVAVTLVIGVTDRTTETEEDRARRIGDQIACPICSGETVTDSQVAIAGQIRGVIAQRIADGRTDQEIRDELAESYGEQVLLNPPKSGVAGLVWVLPVAVLVAAVAGLVVVFRRWRVPAGVLATEEDLAAAERARREVVE